MLSRFLSLERGQVHYLSNDRSDLPALLLLHGNASSAASFDDLANALDGRFHLIALDFPGHGRSDRLSMPADAYAYSMEGLRDLLVKAIACLGLSDYSIAANSLGANIAAQALPSLHGLRALILMASIHSSGKDDFFSNVKPDAPSKTSLKTVFDEADIDVLTRAFIHPSRAGKPYARMARDLRESDGNFREQIVRFMALQPWPDEIALLARSTVPLLYIGGRDDAFIQHAFYRKLAQQVPQLDGRLLLLDNVSHVPHLEDASACARSIVEFAESLRSEAS
ncbi:alpha/beta fold hydrolase [Burkholderia ambifaria]|uniref:alpha/beta fold hydrolase n=1 Tax=Burkholderia ambifaria TaxID=152480 RepID=UPI0013FDED4D|nr:alpha/beta fold hydrolase [Burkholderia ambifaria]MBR8185175.1 alpha/beta fold hydrolase [Burkholderia ambifaria]NHL70377.1 alpha/beta hydrolase [Burkholderia ambifaria]